MFIFLDRYFLCFSHSGLNPLGSVAAKLHSELQNVPGGEVKKKKNADLAEFQNFIQTATAATTRRLDEFSNFGSFSSFFKSYVQKQSAVLAVWHTYHKLPYSLKIGRIKKKRKKNHKDLIKTHLVTLMWKTWRIGTKQSGVWRINCTVHTVLCFFACLYVCFFAICAGRPFVLLLELPQGLQQPLFVLFIFFSPRGRILSLRCHSSDPVDVAGSRPLLSLRLLGAHLCLQL